MSEHNIYDINCPTCGETCWIDNGDVDDLTGVDVEAVICPWCEGHFLMEGCDAWTTLKNANTQRGMKTPSGNNDKEAEIRDAIQIGLSDLIKNGDLALFTNPDRVVNHISKLVLKGM